MTSPAGQFAEVRAIVQDEPPGARDGAGTVGWLQRLCRAVVRTLPASGAGVSLMTDEGAQGTAAASDATSEVVEELQFTCGEGPCLDAFRTGRPVLASDLSDGFMVRWPGYSPAAHDRGVRAVFAFPLQIGAARIGVLDVYRDHSGGLSTQDLSRALTFAEVAKTGLLDGQEAVGTGRPTGGPAEALDNHLELYQAQGMVQVQLGVSLTEAMARLRAHAYADDRRLVDVARDVVARRLNLQSDDPR